MHILVTGGAGYIGSHICKTLAKYGYIPITLDNLSLGHKWAVKWGPFFHGHISDRSLLEKLCKKYDIQGVIHLAALSNVRESEKTPKKYHDNNVVSTQILIEVLKKYHISYFVQSSTCAIYGIPKKNPIEESHSKSPINPYGKTKLEVERILDNTQELTVAALRYFNASGADLEGEIGEAHYPETHLIPLLIETALKKHPFFTIYGDTHPTPDGTPIRDFIHVTDLAEAHVSALKWIMKNKKSISLNLGTGNGQSVNEVVQLVEKTLQRSIPIKKGNPFSGDPSVLIANATQANKLLCWRPKFSDLTTIIETAWQWHKKR